MFVYVCVCVFLLTVISQIHCMRPLQRCLNGGTCDSYTGQCHCAGAKGTLCQYPDATFTTEGKNTTYIIYFVGIVYFTTLNLWHLHICVFLQTSDKWSVVHRPYRSLLNCLAVWLPGCLIICLQAQQRCVKEPCVRMGLCVWRWRAQQQQQWVCVRVTCSRLAACAATPCVRLTLHLHYIFLSSSRSEWVGRWIFHVCRW